MSIPEDALGFGETHYRWRPDVKRLVKRFQHRYDTAANTYVDHPTGWHLDDRSVDFWSPAGRGWAISPAVGHKIFIRLRRRRRPPWWRWLIWQGVIYFPDGTSRVYEDPNDQHYDHVHVTFW